MADDGCSRSVLLGFVSATLRLPVARLEQCSNGAIYCQLLDAHFPSLVPMHKVNFHARDEHEILPNYKLLQLAFDELEIAKAMSVSRLSKGNAADNLEMLQWMYKYLKKHKAQPGYDAEARRTLRRPPLPPDGVPLPSAVAGKFGGGAGSGRVTGSPGSPLSGTSSGRPRLQSSLDIRGGRVDVSHVTSRYREGLAPPAVGHPRRCSLSPPASPTSSTARSFSAQQVLGESITPESGGSMSATSRSVGVDTSTPRADSYGNTSVDAAVGDDGYRATRVDAAVGGDSSSPTAFDAAAGTPALFIDDDDMRAARNGPVAARGAGGGGIGRGSRPYAVATDEYAGMRATLDSWVGVSGNTNTATSRVGGSDAAAAGGVGLGAGSSGTLGDDSVDGATLNFSSAAAAPSPPATAALGTGTAPCSAAATPFVPGIAEAGTTERSAALGSHGVSAPADGEVTVAASPERKPGFGKALAPRGDGDDAVLAPADKSTLMSNGKLPGRAGLALLPADLAGAYGYSSPVGTPKGPVPALTADDAQVLSDALDTARSAVDEADAALMRLSELAGAADGGGGELMLRGRLRSALGVASTLLDHSLLLVSDAAYAHATLAPPPGVFTASDVAAECARLEQRLASMGEHMKDVASQLLVRCSQPLSAERLASAPAASGQLLDPAVSELLARGDADGAVKAVGHAQYALTQAVHRYSAAMVADFLSPPPPQLPPSPLGRVASGPGADSMTAPSKKPSRSFKLGDLQLRRLRNGDVYRGRYASGKKSGDGVYNFANADVYEGAFEADRMDGLGVYSFNHEGRYEGEWASAVYAGHGTETFSRGSTYHGQYDAGLRNGLGACRFFNGDYYEGSWAAGLRDGVGMQQCTDDSNYVGNYAKGKRHGRGIYSFPNGDRYQGEYADDLPHGHGVYVFASGQKYEGEWSQGKKHGWSIYTVDNGQSFVGQWRDSKPQLIHPMDSSDGDGVPEDVHALACAARDAARRAADGAVACAEEHWAVASPGSVAEALHASAGAARSAQAARRRALEAAMHINTAVHASGGGDA